MCLALEPKSGLKVPVDNEYRDLNKDNRGTGIQIASSVDRRTGAQIVDDDAGHNLPGFRGTGAQSISTNEGRDLGSTRGTGVQIASGRK
ncbi:MAG: hypothetical protein V4493_03300 [Pseudomonadota bacterium]